jgi:hypothetical protein
MREVGVQAGKVDRRPRTATLRGRWQHNAIVGRYRTCGAQRPPLQFEWRAAPSRLKRRALINHLRCTCERGSARVHRKCRTYA